MDASIVSPSPESPESLPTRLTPMMAQYFEIKAAKLRPWIQDFNLGAKYDAAMVKSEIKAVEDVLKNAN